MSDELIEAVAKAICRENLISTKQPDDPETMGYYWKSFQGEARAALTAIEAAGYAVVPVEPTSEMIAAGIFAETIVGPGDVKWKAPVNSIYLTMLSARPKVKP